MDPLANLNEQTNLASTLLNNFEQHALERNDYSYEFDVEDVTRLAELVLALHEWRKSGGYDPYVDNHGA